MLNSLVYVDISLIHGKGLFAKKFIPADTVIGTLVGEYTFSNGDHVLWLDDFTGLKVLCDFRYINHSDTPNAAYFNTLEVCAIKDIQPDEEITHDYQVGW